MSTPLNRFTILVCRGPECGDRLDSAAVFGAFEDALKDNPPSCEVELGRYSCFGRCKRGPNVLVREILPSENIMMVRLMPTSGGRAVLYHGVKPDDAADVVSEHVIGGKKLQHLIDRNSARPLVPRNDGSGTPT